MEISVSPLLGEPRQSLLCSVREIVQMPLEFLWIDSRSGFALGPS